MFSKFDEKKHRDVASNIAAQFQFIEFTDQLLNKFTFEAEGKYELPKFIGGGEMEIHSEVEHTICKQGIIVTSSIAETVCFIILKSNNILLPQQFGFDDLIKIATKNNLIDVIEANLLQQLRKLRNNLHLHLDQYKSYDIGFFHADQYETAKSCLYWVLIKLLGLDERVMNIHFPYLPKQNKEELNFEL